MRAAWARVRSHLGPRGVTLAPVGALWVWYGVGLVTTDRVGVSAATAPVTARGGLVAWGVAWIVCGLLALGAALLRPGRDTWGFAAATAPPLVWGMAFAAAAATGQYVEAWASVPIYAVPVILLVIVAALTGGRRRRCVCERGAHGG
ncbi:hypothetical protein [Streptomyces cyaneofuscatus]|uniref:hypothetical protein n=1 Tax=Streptomyces cyaneofuscatus TaxID=66883 RepID=UPI0037F90FCD